MPERRLCRNELVHIIAYDVFSAGRPNQAQAIDLKQDVRGKNINPVVVKTHVTSIVLCNDYIKKCLQGV